MMGCNDCITECPMNGSGLHTCVAVETTPGHGFRFLYKSKEKQTNADRIRAMSDEELCNEYFRILNHQLWNYTDSRLGLLEWLKEEVKE